MKKFDIVVAMTSNYGIGKNGKLPWNLSNELKWFQNITTKTKWPHQINAVIMGRNTWDSLPNNYKPLKNRINIIVSKSLNKYTNLNICNSFNDALVFASNIENIYNIYVIGGKQLYEEAISHNNFKCMYTTIINHNYDCDIFFPLNTNKLIDIDHSPLYYEYDKNINKNISYKIMKFIPRNKSNEFFPDNYMNKGEIQYLDALKRLLTLAKDKHENRETRNSPTYSIFGYPMFFDLERFPIITTKKIYFKGVFEELKFFLQGKSDTNELSKKGVKIWEPNTSREFLDKCGLNYKTGDMGNLYGIQLRAFGCDYQGCDKNYIGSGIDQIKNSLELLIKDPTSRRNIITTFDPSRVHKGVLYPCHGICIQFYLSSDNKLSCHMTQRSADIICGVPFNISSYALLVYLYCAILNGMTNSDKYKPGKLIISIGDLHLYDQDDHIYCAQEQLERTPYEFPELQINKKIKSLDDINDLEFSDIKLINYNTHPAIKVKMIA